MKRFEYRVEPRFQWLTTNGLNNIFSDWELVCILPMKIQALPTEDMLDGFLYTFKREIP